MSNFSIQEPNLDLVNWLSAYFTRRNEPNFALGQAIGTILGMHGLVGFWPGSTTDNSGQMIDKSGNANHLTLNGNPVFKTDNLYSYVEYDGTGDYHSHVDAAIFRITGTETYIDSGSRGLTIGGWVYFTNASGTAEFISSKWGAAGQRSYRLFREAAGTISFEVSVDGTATTTVTSTDTPAQATWVFLMARFDPSTELKIWVNDNTDVNTTSIPASIFNSAASFQISGRLGTTSLLTGRVMYPLLCSAYNSDAIIGNLFQQTRGLFNV